MPTEEEVAHSQVLAMLDQLVYEWHDRYRQRPQHIPDSLNNDSNYRPVVETPEVYQRRLDSLLTPISMPYNDIVHNFIQLYTVQRRDQVRRMLSVKDYYFDYFEEELDKAGLPLMLKYMPVIESALHPTVRSHAGAVGIWQFMYATGKMYGLEINAYVDERRDPYRSTEAALRYLEDMYAIYDDWLLVIASYNCGPGNVNKAIRRSGGHYDFWKIYRWLPRETRGYVPAFIAAAYTFEYAEAHQLFPYNSSMPTAVDTVIVRQEVKLSQLAQVLDVSEDMLRILNPQYRREVIPGDRMKCVLRLPFKQAVRYATLKDSLQHLHQLADTQEKEDQEQKVSSRSTSHSKPNNKHATVHYTVRPGDNLGYIAEWFGVRATDLRRWNHIYGSLIHVGDRLEVRVPKTELARFEGINTMSFAEKQNKFRDQRAEKTEDGRARLFYTVRRGDSLWRIARSYPGVSVNDLKSWNRIGSALYPGQKLVIYRES